MTLLDNSLPAYEFREVHSASTRATPARVFEAIKLVTVHEVPVRPRPGTRRWD